MHMLKGGSLVTFLLLNMTTEDFDLRLAVGEVTIRFASDENTSIQEEAA